MHLILNALALLTWFLLEYIKYKSYITTINALQGKFKASTPSRINKQKIFIKTKSLISVVQIHSQMSTSNVKLEKKK